MKTIISILTMLLSCVIMYAQNEAPTSPQPAKVEKATVQHHHAPSQPNCTVPGGATAIQLTDIQLIESSKKLSDAEKAAFEQRAKTEHETQNPELRLSNESVLYFIQEGRCMATFPAVEKDKESVTVNIRDVETEDTFLMRLKFTPKL